MKNNSKKVSIIIPIYNTGSIAAKLVLKLVKDSYKNLEFILVDDGSTDESYDFLREFKRQYDLKSKNSSAKYKPKITILHQENSGASSARNLGLTKAVGEYVCFIDSDDDIHSGYISALVQAIEDSSVGATVSMAGTALEYYRVATKKTTTSYTSPIKPRLPDEDFTTYILRIFATDGRLHAVNNKIFRRKIIEHFDLHFDEKLSFAEDTKFVLAYLKAAHRVKYDGISFVEKPLYIYNYGTETSTVSLSSLSWGNWEKSFQNLARWTGKKPTKDQMKFLRRIRARWRISHTLAVARSNQSFGHKVQHSNPVLLVIAEVIVKFRR